MIAIQDLPTAGLPQNIRRMNTGQDLPAVADLIELAFSAQMDADGREYLRLMRRAAQEPAAFRWSGGYMAPGPPVQAGLVWEENGRVIGNLSLIPHSDGARRVYLIANVAVHPDFRGRGIGRALTEAALHEIRRSGLRTARLQVRADNPTAHGLYVRLGFQETARRTTWVSPASAGPAPVIKGEQAAVASTTRQDWAAAEIWMRTLYPRQVTWNLPLHIGRLEPGILQGILRALNGEHIRQWSARQAGLLAGVLTWQSSFTSSDLLWLAAPPQDEDAAVAALLPHVHRLANPARQLNLNYPAGRAESAILTSGFTILHTLIWMEHDLTGI